MGLARGRGWGCCGALLESLVEACELGRRSSGKEEQPIRRWLLLLLLAATGTGRAFVSVQVPRLEEAAATLFTREGPVAGVCPEVARQLLPSAVALAAG